MAERSLGLLGIAQKAGKLELGEEPVGMAAQSGRARLIILASDGAEHTRRKARAYGALHGAPVVTLDADKQALGGLFGRSTLALAALTDVQLAKAFLEQPENRERYGQALAAVTEKADTMARRKAKKPRRKKGTR